MLDFKQFTTNLTILENDSDFNEFIGEIITEKARSDSDGTQPWANIYSTDRVELEAHFNKEVKPFVDKSIKEYDRGLKKLASFAKNAKVITDVKTTKSIISKLKRDYELTSMHDILRGAILVNTPEEAALIDKKVKNVFRLYWSEFKEFGGDKNFGYFGSYHYKVELKTGVIAEIQLMTRSLWNTKKEAHIIYTQTRDKISNDPNFKATGEFKRLQKLSRDLFRRGSGDKKVQIR